MTTRELIEKLQTMDPNATIKTIRPRDIDDELTENITVDEFDNYGEKVIVICGEPAL